MVEIHPAVASCSPLRCAASRSNSARFRSANRRCSFRSKVSPGNDILVQWSPDLVNWLPVDLFLSGAAPHTTTDTFTNTNSARFYSAMQVDGSLQILQFSPASGGPA